MYFYFNMVIDYVIEPACSVIKMSGHVSIKRTGALLRLWLELIKNERRE